VEKEVIVERGHLEAVVECDTHHGVDLVFEQNGVAHDHYAMCRWGEGCPGAKTHEGRHVPAFHLNLHLIARLTDFENILVGNHGPLHADDLLYSRCVEWGLRSSGLGRYRRSQ